MWCALALWSLSVGGFPDVDARGRPYVRSESVVVRWADTGEVVFTKNPDELRPIASVTKLLSALVLERAGVELPAEVTLDEADKDRLKWSRSRLPIGRTFPGRGLLEAALVASDNRAMVAVVRGAGLGRDDFVTKMNTIAAELGMVRSRFVDPAGLSPDNVSTAAELVRLADAVAESAEIPAITQLERVELPNGERRALILSNTNRLLRSSRWSVRFAKTGYTVEAGRSLLLRAEIGGRPADIVLLGAREMASIFGDAGRIRRWLLARSEAVASAP